MNMKRLVQLVIVAALAFATPAKATIVYSCDFENPADSARWVLNPIAPAFASQLVNKWYIGHAGQSGAEGHNGLFISDDGGLTAHYTATSCFVFAYDTLSLKANTNDYTIFFDYKAMGNVASNFDGLYLFWIPEKDPDTGKDIQVLSTLTSGVIPTKYEPYQIALQNVTSTPGFLNGSPTWRQCISSIPKEKCDGTRHYLAFVWTNGANIAQQPGGVLDNINITDEPLCEPPTNLQIVPTGATIKMTWDADSGAVYEVSAYSIDADSWYGPRLVVDSQYIFPALPIGQTDFFVRKQCEPGLWSYKAIGSRLVYYPDQMCVDYLNLDNAVCYVNKSSPSDARTFNDFVVQRVDNGPAQKSSRHTVHFDTNELEPRTGGLAHTIPTGELAAVRLGNWESGNQAERIEFSFDVDTIKFPVLQLKYMPILEAPGHSNQEDPRFKLDILIGGESVGECGQADFSAYDIYKSGKLVPGAAAQGWHITDRTTAQTSSDVVWKEWTTVGINLRDSKYAGQKLTARLTTHDCTQSGHFGYAYFTLSCSNGKLQGMKCGEINPVFEAPDGFNYRWMLASSEQYRGIDGSVPEQYVLGRGQTYNAGMHDDNVYIVDCMFVQDSTCYFSLFASTLATNPIAVMDDPVISKNCREDKYTVQFDGSKSWIQEINHVTHDTTESHAYTIDYYEWLVRPVGGDTTGIAKLSNDVNPVFEFPGTGGDFLVSLSITAGTCDSTIYYNLHLDPLGATRDTTTVVLCDADRKAGYVWAEKPDTVYHTYGQDSVVIVDTITFCDSIIYLNLVEPLRIYEDTMLLPESLPFTYHGRTYGPDTKTMVDTVPSPTNCDSTWVLNLEIYESLIATMPNQAYVLCEGDPVLSIIYDIARGRSLRASYSFSSPEIGDTLINGMQKKGHYQTDLPLDDIYPNVYNGTLLLVDSMPEFSVTIPFTVTMNYSKDVITQRWNDVLAIRNADYNGGYQFDSVQWYLGGLPIEGAIDFNYYAGMGNKLQFGSEYTALLTRNDGVKLFTCPFIPTAVPAEIADLPSLVPLSAPMHVQGKGTATWVDMLGRVHHTDAYDNSDIVAPGITGYFLLVLQGNDSRTIHHVMVR